MVEWRDECNTQALSTGIYSTSIFLSHLTKLIISSSQHRDDIEDQELDAAQLMEGMPTTMGGFKDHPM